jgi:hypothetical protein
MERAEDHFEEANHGNQRERVRWDLEARLRNFPDKMLHKWAGKHARRAESVRRMGHGPGEVYDTLLAQARDGSHTHSVNCSGEATKCTYSSPQEPPSTGSKNSEDDMTMIEVPDKPNVPSGNKMAKTRDWDLGLFMRSATANLMVACQNHGQDQLPTGTLPIFMYGERFNPILVRPASCWISGESAPGRQPRLSQSACPLEGCQSAYRWFLLCGPRST